MHHLKQDFVKQLPKKVRSLDSRKPDVFLISKATEEALLYNSSCGRAILQIWILQGHVRS